jgi:hypothetical protein
MKITIRTVSNGYILETEDNAIVFDTDENHYESIHTMLYTLLEQIGEYGSKHDEKRINIKIEEKGKDY